MNEILGFVYLNQPMVLKGDHGFRFFSMREQTLLHHEIIIGNEEINAWQRRFEDYYFDDLLNLAEALGADFKFTHHFAD
jgi:hypothetical protein